MAVLKRIAKALKDLQLMPNLFEIVLINEEIDNWEVTFKYPAEKFVVLHVQHHLVHSLPPKMTVVFPDSISYVCFAELGTQSWTAQSDIVALFLAIHNEYKDRCQKLGAGKVMAAERSQKEWAYVQNAHRDWKIVDVAEEAARMTPEALAKLREVGANALANSGELLKKSTELMPEGVDVVPLRSSAEVRAESEAQRQQAMAEDIAREEARRQQREAELNERQGRQEAERAELKVRREAKKQNKAANLQFREERRQKFPFLEGKLPENLGVSMEPIDGLFADEPEVLFENNPFPALAARAPAAPAAALSPAAAEALAFQALAKSLDNLEVNYSELVESATRRTQAAIRVLVC